VNASPPAERAKMRQGAVQVLDRLQAAGFTAYLAGGCVRDEIMGRAPIDYDIATDARPERVEALFAGSKTVGKSFGVVRVPSAGHFYEVATFRSDHGYSDGRRPDRVVFTDPRTDASRRDFTVNALFYDVRAQRVIDFVGGRADIGERLVRCVGDPHERLREDYLRMLRAVRFAAVLDFEIERETAAAIRHHAPLAASIAPERVREELTRILVESPRAGDAIRLMEETGLLRVLLPEVDAMKGQEQPPRFHPEGDVFEHAVLMLNLMREPSPRLAFAALLHDVGKPGTARLDGDRIRFNRHAAQGSELASSILKRLRFSNADTDAIVHMIRNHMRFMDVRKMRRATLRRFVGQPTFDLELELHRLDCLASHGQLDNYDFLQAYKRELASEPVLPFAWVSGRDIIALGLAEGPAIGRWKRMAYDAQIENRFKTRGELLQWLKTRIESVESGGNANDDPRRGDPARIRKPSSRPN